jgi:hypothetical protein
MITGAIKSQIDQIWNAFWSGGISNEDRIRTYKPPLNLLRGKAGNSQVWPLLAPGRRQPQTFASLSCDFGVAAFVAALR